jgi:hypothetical protein
MPVASAATQLEKAGLRCSTSRVEIAKRRVERDAIRGHIRKNADTNVVCGMCGRVVGVVTRHIVVVTDSRAKS